MNTYDNILKKNMEKVKNAYDELKEYSFMEPLDKSEKYFYNHSIDKKIKILDRKKELRNIIAKYQDQRNLFLDE